jgi:hypothetical protein
MGLTLLDAGFAVTLVLRGSSDVPPGDVPVVREVRQRRRRRRRGKTGTDRQTDRQREELTSGRAAGVAARG